MPTPAAVPAAKAAAPIITTVPTKPAPVIEADPLTQSLDAASMKLQQTANALAAINPAVIVPLICAAALGYAAYLYYKSGDTHRANFYVLMSIGLGMLLR